MASAFNTQGALPSFNAVPGQSFNVMPQSTSAGKALNYAQAGGNAPNMSTNHGPVYASPPNLPIKNQTIVAPDGSKHTTTYDTSGSSTTPNNAPNQTMAEGTGTPGYTYTNGKLTSVGGQSIGTTSGILNSSQSQSTPNANGGSTLSAPGYGGVNGTPSDTSTGGTYINGQFVPFPKPGSPEWNSRFLLGQESSGMLQTPNGTSVDAQGNIINSASQPTNTYSGLIGSAVNSAQSNAGIGQNAAEIAAQYGKNISNIETQGNNAQAGYLSTGTTPVAEGGAAIIANTQANQIAGQAKAEEAALQGTGQQLTAQNQQTSGLLGAAGAAAPIQVPYNNQIINPQTGQPTNGTGSAGTLPAAAQTFVNSLAQQVQNGQMTRDEATDQLSVYGTAGLQALNTALGSNFNTNASNASAGTTATGQQIQTAADSTNKALDTLSTSFNSLSGLETGGIPVTNSIAQWIGSNLGDSALTQYKTNLADARSQLIGVLNSSGGTPTGNESTANQYLPDNMTPAQFQQNVGTAQNPGIVRQLIAQKVDSFTNSGQQNNSNANTSSTPAGWL